MMLHTTGPWQAVKARTQWHIRAGNQYLGALPARWSGKSVEGNAHLMAAAPDLLDLALLFDKTIEHYIAQDRRAGDEEGARLKTGTLNTVRQAIAKATGAA